MIMKLPMFFFVIIRIVIVARFDLVSGIIIITLFQCN